MVTGTVLRSHSGGYLVHSDELGVTLQCAARGRLKKERVSIVTGDRVELDEVDVTGGTGVITVVLERGSVLTRPVIANVNQVAIVQAVHQPEFNHLLCDRYLVHCHLELPEAELLLCLNKSDLASRDDLEAVRRIYEPLNYNVLLISAVTGQGMDDFAAALSGRVSVLAGPSGVGKSSILNYLDPSLHLKVGVMDHDFGTGRHTTTYSELYRLPIGDDPAHHSTWVADTPGFLLTELKHPEPCDVALQFPEIIELAAECRFSDCLHIVEEGCNVLANIRQIPASRYASYSTIVAEAQEEARIRRDTSQKVEPTVKFVGGRAGQGKAVPRLSGKYRAPSRRTEKQRLEELASRSEEELGDDEDMDND